MTTPGFDNSCDPTDGHLGLFETTAQGRYLDGVDGAEPSHVPLAGVGERPYDISYQTLLAGPGY